MKLVEEENGVSWLLSLCVLEYESERRSAQTSIVRFFVKKNAKFCEATRMCVCLVGKT